MRDFLISAAHVSIFVICYGIALVIHPHAGSGVAGIFVGAWVSVARLWKQKCHDRVRQLEHEIDELEYKRSSMANRYIDGVSLSQLGAIERARAESESKKGGE